MIDCTSTESKFEECGYMRQDYSDQAVNDETVMSARSIKKSTGSYYTPEHLAGLISRDTLFRWLSERANTEIKNVENLSELGSKIRNNLLNHVKRVTILDPAVGEGAFLLATANWIRKIRIKLGDKIADKKLRELIVTDCLFGVDLAQHAISSCESQISSWINKGEKSKPAMNIRHGNSLVGYVKFPINNGLPSQSEIDTTLCQVLSPRNPAKIRKSLNNAGPFHWGIEFPSVFSGESPGFDIVIGNPPYGSLLGPVEKRFISELYSFSVGGGRIGTWNSAAHFLVRSFSLMKDGAQLGFLVPNSFLRVKQFSKTRKFLLNHTKLWKIVDEGSPFHDVTLEMVSLFCEQKQIDGEHKIRVESRRLGLEQSNMVSSRVLKESRVFPIYHDHILARILKRGQKHLLVAGRGRDIPKEHVRKKQTPRFKTPYMTSGRSVQRYGLREQYVVYTDDWFRKDSALNESFESEFLVATKNYRYPRCILKPQGMIHGGGIVRITPLYENADLRVLGLILNSKLVRQISIRYLTNYSQLTCCLNTGIMEEIPLVLPQHPQIFRRLFDALSNLHSHQEDYPDRNFISALERLADALVYSLYFGDDNLEQRVCEGIDDLPSAVYEPDVIKAIDEILAESLVKELERLGSFPASRKLRRY